MPRAALRRIGERKTATQSRILSHDSRAWVVSKNKKNTRSVKGNSVHIGCREGEGSTVHFDISDTDGDERCATRAAGRGVVRRGVPHDDGCGQRLPREVSDGWVRRVLSLSIGVAVESGVRCDHGCLWREECKLFLVGWWCHGGCTRRGCCGGGSRGAGRAGRDRVAFRASNAGRVVRARIPPQVAVSARDCVQHFHSVAPTISSSTKKQSLRRILVRIVLLCI